MEPSRFHSQRPGRIAKQAPPPIRRRCWSNSDRSGCAPSRLTAPIQLREAMVEASGAVVLKINLGPHLCSVGVGHRSW